jgi:hypothetical protein
MVYERIQVRPAPYCCGVEGDRPSFDSLAGALA